MSEEKILKMTLLALQSTNALEDSMTKALAQFSCKCPVCVIAHEHTRSNLDKIEQQRRDLIDNARSPSEHERCAIALNTGTFVSMMSSALEERLQLCTASHAVQKKILDMRVTAIVIGKSTDSDKEMMRRAIESASDGPGRDKLRKMLDSMPEVIFDPTKSN